jgi:hypothetical protein
MGAIMTDRPSKGDPWEVVFNTPLETGLRSAYLLLAASPARCDIQRLVQYDYLVVHSGDVDGGPESIHPATPHRSGELLVRRKLVEQGLEFMARRLVVERDFTADGITYRAGEYAVLFLDALTSKYAAQLRARAEWVVKRFSGMSDQELADYMRERWSRWGSEFVWDALLGEAE